jgi:hypothetical protein
LKNKRQTIDRKKVFAKHIADKVLVSRIAIVKKKKNQPDCKWAKDSKYLLIGEDIRLVNDA